MTGIHGYRPTPTLSIPRWLNFLTPPELFAVVGWALVALALREVEVAVTAVAFVLAAISGVKYLHAVPRNWRPPVPTGPV